MSKEKTRHDPDVVEDYSAGISIGCLFKPTRGQGSGEIKEVGYTPSMLYSQILKGGHLSHFPARVGTCQVSEPIQYHRGAP